MKNKNRRRETEARLARLERKWLRQQRLYCYETRYGVMVVPTEGGAFLFLLLSLAFGVLVATSFGWVGVAISVLIFTWGLAACRNIYHRSQMYQQLRRDFRCQRSRLIRHEKTVR